MDFREIEILNTIESEPDSEEEAKLSPEEGRSVTDLYQTFLAKDDSGLISKAEILSVISSIDDSTGYDELKIHISQRKVDALLAKLEFDKNEKVPYQNLLF